MKSQTAYPLCWPPGRARCRYSTGLCSRFGDVSFARARDTLLSEIQRMGGTDIILSTNVPLRQDGLPYSNQAQPKDRGVAVYFQWKKKSMAFACDEWNKVEHNLWAIAKTIEALRGINRWGSGEMVERAFTGFTQLPAPAQKKHWREILGFMGGVAVSESELSARRDELALSAHPDRGGSHERMVEINNAFEEALEERSL